MRVRKPSPDDTDLTVARRCSNENLDYIIKYRIKRGYPRGDGYPQFPRAHAMSVPTVRVFRKD